MQAFLSLGDSASGSPVKLNAQDQEQIKLLTLQVAVFKEIDNEALSFGSS